MKYIVVTLFALAAFEAVRGEFHHAAFCLTIALGAFVDAPARTVNE